MSVNISMGFDRLLTGIGIEDNEFIVIDITHTEDNPVLDYIVSYKNKVLYFN